MKLIQISVLSCISTLIKVLTGILILKMVAIYTGPEGVAILGQFTSLVNVFSVVAGGGIGLGVIKYVAESAHMQKSLRQFINSAAIYTLFFSILSMLFGVYFSEALSSWILGTKKYAYLIRWMSIAQIFIAINLLICSILNGLGKIRLLVIINLISSCVGLILICTFAVYYQIEGALLALILFQVTSSLISIALIYREKWFIFLLPFKPKMKCILNLSQYSLMCITSTLTVPISQILVRNDLNTLFGWDSVGYWQAVVRLSDAYLLFVTTALAAYYLPRLSALTDMQKIRREMWAVYKILMPMVALVLIIIYIFRDFIITFIFSKNFEAASGLFFYQLLGDFFRIAAWLCTYLLLAKSWTKMYISTEIILSVLFVVVSHFFVRYYGLVGVTYAFALTYCMYWLLMIGVVTVYFKFEGTNSLWWQGLAKCTDLVD